MLRPVVGLYLSGALTVWRREDIAMIREEVLGRLEVTSCRGEVGHRPGPLWTHVGAPWAEVTPGCWIHPRHAVDDGDQVRLPGGWSLPGAVPGHAPPVQDPVVPELGCRRSQIVSAQDGTWVTDDGAVSSPLSPSSCEWMAQAGRVWLNLLRVERVERSGEQWRVSMRGAGPVTIGRNGFASLCAALDLEPGDPSHGSGPLAALYRLGLRDWPDELLYCEADVLRERFGTDAQAAIQQVIWQSKRLRERGLAEVYGRDIRGFYYSPVEPVLQRLEFMEVACAEPDPWRLDEGASWTGDPLYFLYLRVLGKMVGDLRLLMFRDLRFHDPRPDMRQLGSSRPWVLVGAEKTSVREDAFLLGARYGASVVVLGGYPSLLGTEMLVAALAPLVGDREVELVTLVDFDVDGWDVWKGLVGQFDRFGMKCRVRGHLVRPERFTEWELRNLKSRIDTDGPMRQEKARQWLEETGGIHGRLEGMHADHLRPVERLYQAFEEEVPDTS